MWVELGNSHAVEAIRGADGTLTLRSLPGERVTRHVIPRGYNVEEAHQTIVLGARVHFAEDPETGQPHAPDWVAASDDALYALLCQTYVLKQGHRIPKNWGRDTGVDPDQLLHARGEKP